MERLSRRLFQNKTKKTSVLTHGIEGKSVGAQQAVGECISNQSETGERQGYCINTIPHTLMFSSRVWGSRMRNTMQKPIVHDVKDENPVRLDPGQICKC